MSPITTRAGRVAGLVLGLVLSPMAQASCGASSCNLLNDRFALGTWEHPGWTLDLRLEALDLSRLRQGGHVLSPQDLPAGEEALERHTRHRALVTTLDRAFDAEWSIALRLAALQREHLHQPIEEDTGALGDPERWRYARPGDLQVLGRWQPVADAADGAWALSAGLKLPTGSHRVRNVQGVVAERAMQPGTGTVDTVLGASRRQVLGLADALNLQLTWQRALAAADHYRPGDRVDASVGWVHAVTPGWSTSLQLNLGWRGRDHGAEAEPELSGGSRLSLSPGLSWAASPADTLQTHLQWPLWQHVNGVQLTPRHGLSAGWTHAF